MNVIFFIEKEIENEDPVIRVRYVQCLSNSIGNPFDYQIDELLKLIHFERDIFIRAELTLNTWHLWNNP